MTACYLNTKHERIGTWAAGLAVAGFPPQGGVHLPEAVQVRNVRRISGVAEHQKAATTRGGFAV